MLVNLGTRVGNLYVSNPETTLMCFKLKKYKRAGT